MFFYPQKLKSENNNPWFKPWFSILLHTKSIVCATVDLQCLEYLGQITLISTWHWYCLFLQKLHKYWKNQLELKNKVVVYLYSIRDLKVFYGRHLCFEKKGNNSCALCVQALQLKNLPKIGRVLKGNGKKVCAVRIAFQDATRF